MLYGSMILGMGLSFGSSMFTTRYLNPDEYGNLKFITTFWYLLSILFTFGIFHSAGQALLKENDSIRIRRIIGGDILISFFIGVFISILSFVLAVPIETIFKINISQSLRIVSPFLFILPMKDSLTLAFQCTNKINLLSFLNILPPVFFLVYLSLLPVFTKANLINITIGQQLSFTVVIVVMMIVLKPSFNDLKNTFKNINQFQSNYEAPIASQLCSVVTQQLNRLGIVYWVDSASIGYYSLATQLVDPLRLIPSSVATVSFKEFSTQNKISKNVLRATVLAAFGALIAILIVFGKPLTWIYPETYAQSISSIGRVLAFSSMFLGLGEIINRF